MPLKSRITRSRSRSNSVTAWRSSDVSLPPTKSPVQNRTAESSLNWDSSFRVMALLRSKAGIRCEGSDGEIVTDQSKYVDQKKFRRPVARRLPRVARPAGYFLLQSIARGKIHRKFSRL